MEEFASPHNAKWKENAVLGILAIVPAVFENRRQNFERRSQVRGIVFDDAATVAARRFSALGSISVVPLEATTAERADKPFRRFRREFNSLQWEYCGRFQGPVAYFGRRCSSVPRLMGDTRQRSDVAGIPLDVQKIQGETKPATKRFWRSR